MASNKRQDDGVSPAGCRQNFDNRIPSEDCCKKERNEIDRKILINTEAKIRSETENSHMANYTRIAKLKYPYKLQN